MYIPTVKQPSSSNAEYTGLKHKISFLSSAPLCMQRTVFVKESSDWVIPTWSKQDNTVGHSPPGHSVTNYRKQSELFSV